MDTTPRARAERVLEELLEGNRRFRSGCRRAGDAAGPAALAGPHRPHAVVLACADARSAPELVLDARPGELFVVRAAGAVASPAIAASVAFAVNELRVPLVLVLGHTGCGAVAALAGSGGRLPAPLTALGRAMTGLLHHVPREAGEPTEAWRRRLEVANVRHQAERLLGRCAPLRRAVAAGACRLEAAILDLGTGAVRLLPGVVPPG